MGKLSDKAIQAAKAKEKQYCILDGDGLTLIVKPSGKKVWWFRYRFAGKEKTLSIGRYRKAYAQYCWDVVGLADLRLAPFHLLASEGGVHIDRDHTWHMGQLARLAEALPGLVIATPHRVVEFADEASCESAMEWWTSMTASGGEGMVVKPFEFVARSHKGVLQPAIKCRGPEYLRIIYGPEYLLPGSLERFRERGLSAKRGLALKELHLELNRCSVLSSALRFGMSTNARLAYWRWKANRSIRAYKSV